MKLRTLPAKLDAWEGKRVLLRVDWNVSLEGALDGESLLRLTRSLPVLHRLTEAGARVLVLTHCGRPTSARDGAYSTEHLVPLLKRVGIRVAWHDADLSSAEEREHLVQTIDRAKPGTIHLLENIRFYPGEEKNLKAFAKHLASIGDVFVNDAFSVSHRAHASILGVTQYLDSYAGPGLCEEVEALKPFIKKATAADTPTIAFFGGKKLSSKKEPILRLMKTAQKVYLGGAMALAGEAARGRSLGRSYLEPGQERFAKQLVAAKNVVFPVDYVVVSDLNPEAKTRISDGTDIAAKESIVDVGPRTLMLWAEAIRSAKRALWNGPMGIAEIDPFGAGSRGLARFLGYISPKAKTVAGGGDTIPILAQAGVMDRLSFVSTGGGALLDYLVRGETLPGIKPLLHR